jgi:3-isopropylmalate/(R)-2-methylmalate dehydratase small subunit
MTTLIDGVAVPFDYAGVDTDALFPVSAEGVADRHGYGAALFGRWRQDPEFILNHAPYAGAPILVTGPDFGIGSSRETAVWALRGAGIRAVLAPSFGDIFRSNCIRNQILAGTITRPDRDRLHAHLEAHRGLTLRIDLVGSTVTTGDGALSAPVAVDGFARRCLVAGLDEFRILAAAAAGTRASLGRQAAWAPDTVQIFPESVTGDSR